MNKKVKDDTVEPLIEKWVATSSSKEGQSEKHIPAKNQWGPVNAEIIPLGADEVGVTWPPHESRSSTGLLVIDPEFGAIDKIGCVTLRVNCNVSGLKLFDGEIDPDGNPLDRDIFLFEPEEFAKLFIPGEQATACYHFRGGRNLRHDREPYMFYPNPKMNPPLLASGIPLLRTVFPTIYGRRKDDLQNISNTERYSVGVDAEKSSGLEPETSHDSLSHS